MAIELEFINVIIPISIIHEKYRGGWEQCLRNFQHLIGGRVYYDEFLFRDGAMSPPGVKLIVDHWEGMGLQPMKELDGETVWNDLCVAEFGATTRPCSWLCFADSGRAAYLNGTDSGEVINGDKMKSFRRW